jgi:glycosyltransferase involved in cell wall biosynthesis
MVLISVVIPVYNGAKTIQATINSVLNQTFSDFELIVIDDGSTDSTLQIISTIKDDRLNVFSYPNAGVSASRNRGIAKATGKYIAFLDSDDLWTSDKLELQLAALETTQAAIAYSWTDWIDESGQFLRPGGHIAESGNVYVKLLIRDFIESGSNPLILKQALDEVGNFDESISAAEDWDVWLRLAARYEFVAIPSPQILYRVSPNSLSSNVCDMEVASLKVIEQAFAQNPPFSDPGATAALKRKVLGNRYQYLTLKALEGNLKRRQGLISARFFWLAIVNDPAWLKRTKLMLVILLKLVATVSLPPHQTRKIITAIKAFRRRSQAQTRSVES